MAPLGNTSLAFSSTSSTQDKWAKLAGGSEGEDEVEEEVILFFFCVNFWDNLYKINK
jgi:hypothetical protein